MTTFFDYSEQNRVNYEAISRLPDEVLDQDVNDAYPEGIKELEDILTFIPEEKRTAAIMGFIGGMLVT